MTKTNSNLVKDLVLIALSVAIAIALVEYGVIDQLLTKSLELGMLGSFVAGIFFTSIFTTVPAIAILVEISANEPLAPTVIAGGLGAVFGDYILFRLIRHHIRQDVKTLLRIPQKSRFRYIFSTKIPKWFLALIGGLIIASPLPDELGIALIGFSKANTFSFAIISFICNTLGILIIALLARA